jgi:hypothetical protein
MTVKKNVLARDVITISLNLILNIIVYSGLDSNEILKKLA